MSRPDPGLTAVLARFGIARTQPIGAGGEATVYALGTERVLRVAHPGTDASDLQQRYELLAELARTPLPFALPEVLDTGETAGRRWAVERRHPGAPLATALVAARGPARVRLVEGYLAAAATLGDVVPEARPWFGDLIGPEPVRADTFAGWLLARAASGLARSTPELQAVDPEPLAAAVATALGPSSPPAFVHLDVTPTNVLTEYGRITAVLDIGPSSAIGDRRLDPVTAAVHLCEPAVTPGVTPADVDAARGWLRAAGLDELYAPVRRWLGAFWAFATDDAGALAMCRTVLLEES
ncbi:MAG: phosphotransferase family protein [Actinomycetota bacterium]